MQCAYDMMGHLSALDLSKSTCLRCQQQFLMSIEACKTFGHQRVVDSAVFVTQSCILRVILVDVFLWSLSNSTCLQVPPNYDSLLGKLIVWAEDQPSAINRMRRALNELVISGVPTTIQYHTMILDIENFQKGIVDTGFIPKHAEELKEPPPSPKTVSILHGMTDVLETCHCTCPEPAGVRTS